MQSRIPIKMYGSSIVRYFIIFRLVLVPIIQTWFVPDESWQVTEVSHNWKYGYGHLCWEWEEGIRSILYPGIFTIVFQVLSIFHLDCRITLIHVPRILSAIIFAIGDYYIIQVAAILFGRKSTGWVALSLASSWFLAYCSPRTLSSCVEMTVYALTLHNFPWHLEKVQVKCSYLWWIGIGCIIRPTLGIVFLPFFVSHILHCQRRWILLVNCFPIIISILTVSIALDSVVYGKLTVVPWNFLQFNVLKGLSGHYGTHAWHWYFTQGLPVTCGLHLFPLVFGLKQNFMKYKNLFLPTLWTILIYSCLGHKEFRFILPVIPSLLCIAGDSIHCFLKKLTKKNENKWRNIAIVLLAIPNITTLLYMGCIHQRGPLDVMTQLYSSIIQNPSSSILFLTPCHSTPLYSHLHVNVPVRFLTCRPNLADKQDYIDEADQFFLSPLKWMEEEFSDGNTSSKDILASHIVMYDSLEKELLPFLLKRNYTRRHEVFNANFFEKRQGKFFYIYINS